MRMRVMTGVLTIALTGPPLSAQSFHPSDPMWRDDDTVVDVTQQPEEIELSDLYDRFSHIFHVFGEPAYPAFREAQNVNSLDEVPDSSWFVNRHGRTRLSLAELEQGSNVDGPPNPNETWTIIAGKSQGITPGFTIEDTRGDRYVIKFDPVQIPELSTAAEAIGTKIFHALGYHVPQNYIVSIHPDNLAIAPDTMVEDSFGDAVLLTGFRVQRMLRRVPRDEQGRMRVVASKFIEGVPLGPFRYYGTRADDPNDVIPHEHRRELRGMRLFAAWINHDDTRAQNTQASWVNQGGRHHVRHWMMDFGSTFGSGSVDLQLPNLGFEYWLDLGEVKRNAAGFGLRVPRYRTVTWPNFPQYESVGRWEGDAFDPLTWKNDYPNPAFVRMTERDAFWAAKILMRLTAAELMAIVKTGEFSDLEQEQYFHEVLVQRQLKTGRAGITMLNPVDEFQVADGALAFENLAERYGFVEQGSTSYELSWSLFDNTASRVIRALGTSSAGTSSPAQIPDIDALDGTNMLLIAEMSSLHAEYPSWTRPVRIYLRSDAATYDVVGIERESGQQYVDLGPGA